MASGAGVLWVSSKILDPTKLSVSHFDAWYENEHAPEVLALAGVPSATRYTALSPTPSPYLIVYDLPDLAYISHPDFAAVANASPSQHLIDTIYAHASFDIRFYSQLPGSGTLVASRDTRAGRKLASIALHPVAGREIEFKPWFEKDLSEGLARVSGFIDIRRFELVSGVLREGNVVSAPERAKYLVLVGFEAEGVVEREVEGLVEGGLCTAEVGWFGVRRVWGKGMCGRVGRRLVLEGGSMDKY